MSYRLIRKTRPQGDVEIYGGPLKQRSFDGGMNLDVPASEIGENELAYALNVICREHSIEPKAGSVTVSRNGFSDLSTPANVTGFASNPLIVGSFGTNYRNTVIRSGEIRSYGENPFNGGYVAAGAYDYSSNTNGVWAAGSGDQTIIPYRRGFVIFNSSKITYTEFNGAFQINSPNPVHGISDDNAGAGTFKYRYILTLSRISAYGSDNQISSFVSTDRQTSDAEIVHESGTNSKNYNSSGTSTARKTDYGEVFVASAISASSAYALTNADLKAALSTAAGVTNDLAAKHFTHISIYRTTDYGDAGIALGNNNAIFYWVADVKRSDVVGGAGFSDVFSDKSIQDTGIILKTQGFSPMPSGSCGEIAGGWLFVSDRTNAFPENYLNYCPVSSSPENFGYYFKDIQKWKFDQGIRAMRANQDILSVFCESSSHIINMTSVVTDASKLQYIPFLNYVHAVDRHVGIKDWATLDSIDDNTMIAVCSDNSVRKWDTTKWGDDLSYNKVSSEIKQIVPASTITYERGSVGKYYNGAYYLWYSKDLSDTKTTTCLRYGMGVADSKFGIGSNKQAGFGWTFYSGGPQPNFKRGVQIVHEVQGVQRLIVLDCVSGKFYWMETFKPFIGAIDTGTASATHQMDRFDLDLVDFENPSTSGTEISSSWKFRELIGDSESDVLIHEETFNRWRPLSETIGYRTGFSISMSAYKDGSNTSAETITTQPKTAALKFTKEIAARRVQLAITTSVGAWRYVGVDSLFRRLDKVNFATAGDNSSGESTTSYPQFQAELATNLNHWITRRETVIDCAIGSLLVATGVPTLTTGPDAKTESAYSFNSSYYTVAASNTYAADFSISFFVSLPTTNVNFISIAGTTALTCKFTNATTLSFSGLGTVTVSSVAAGWHHFFIKRTSGTISVYQNGVLKGTIASAASLGGGSLVLGMVSASCLISDFRAYSDVKTVAGMAYYYDNVINSNGDQVMPQV